MKPMKSIGEKIDFLCLNSHKKKYIIAKELGINQSYLSRLISNNTKPSKKMIDKMCDYFNVDKSYFENITPPEYEVVGLNELPESLKQWLFNLQRRDISFLILARIISRMDISNDEILEMIKTIKKE